MTAAADPFSNASLAVSAPARGGATVVPHDTTELAKVTRGIYVGGAGDIVLVTADGDTLTFKAVPVGSLLPVQAKIIKSTSTTATLMLALW